MSGDCGRQEHVVDGTDPFDLQRFVTAQEGTYARAVAELRRGRKTSHWMWFVFPQVQGLGRSPVAQRYAVTGVAEARAYLEHPVLGVRLRECAGILTELTARAQITGVDERSGDPAVAVFGEVDAMKLRSSMTLFAAVEPNTVFTQVLDEYFAGEPDPATLSRL